ncbi:MAG: cytochrome oxidase biogenesis protein Surf1, facilitates heme A insertion [Alphaproteobacteria bacterium]|nr:MAG: cytochrome oxidase biogenesis protein Surf1, facilitates heme A insertion [Alphaproteobacteria bacterium]
MKLPFWGTVLTIIGVAILCTLGTWQVQRLQWKSDILDAIEAEYAVDASENLLSQAMLSEEIDFKRGHIVGTYMHDKTVLLQPRMHDGEVGYHVLTPLYLSGAQDIIILVNRGWVPFDWDVLGDDKARKPDGVLKITGMLRSVPRVSSFVPENVPAQSMWYRIDLEQIAVVRGLKGVASNIFYVETEGADEKMYPIAAATRINPNNNHAQYAFFWFAMAVAMVGIYILRFIAPQMNREK